MRTTITLDDGLFAELKALAARTGRTMASLVEDAIRESLGRRRASKRRRVELPVFHGTGLQPGVDLDDSAGLLDLMEERRAPA